MKTKGKKFGAAQWGKLLLLASLAMGLPGDGEATSGSFNAPIEIVTKKLGSLNVAFLRFGKLFCGEFSTCFVKITATSTQPFHICTSNSPSFGTAVCNINETGAAQFLISGAPNAFYNISLPNTIPLTDTSNGFIITNFVGTNVAAVSENIASATIGKLDSSGNDRVFVGATVTYFGSPTASPVTSNFTITVSYQ